MKYAAWFLVSLLCAPAFGQSAPKPGVNGLPRLPVPFLAAKPPAKPPAKPWVCAIPLLNVKPGPIKDKMPIAKPPVSAFEKTRELNLQVPAPACDEKLFQNQ
jgi:hypothetical protein